MKLQRVAVETLSSILLMCPTNQKIVLEDLNSEWSASPSFILEFILFEELSPKRRRMELNSRICLQAQISETGAATMWRLFCASKHCGNLLQAIEKKP